MPVDGGVAPRRASGTDFRGRESRIDGQLYENFEWLTEFDVVNQLQVNSLADPTQKQAVAPKPTSTGG